jgi:hypothetical protein
MAQAPRFQVQRGANPTSMADQKTAEWFSVSLNAYRAPAAPNTGRCRISFERPKRASPPIDLAVDTTIGTADMEVVVIG